MTDEMTNTFVEDGSEHLRTIETKLIDLENDPSDDEAMNKLFRSAHSLKGNAGTMDFNEFSKLAHAMEDVLQEVRAGRMEVTQDLMDTLFDTSDLMREMVDEVKETGDTQTDPADAIENLRELIEKGTDGDEVETDDSGDETTSDEPDVEVTDVDELIKEVGELNTEYGAGYHVVFRITDEGTNETVLDGLTDAFTVVGTKPSEEKINGKYTGPIGTLIAGSEEELDNINDIFGEFDEVADTTIIDVSEQVEWVDQLGMDDVEELIGTDTFDEPDEFDEELVDDVDLNMEDVGESGTFDSAEAEETVLDQDVPSDDELDVEIDDDDFEEEPEAEEDKEDDTPDLEDQRVFNELQEEVDEADTFDEIEEEMDDMGFGEDYDEMDDDEEVGFDELIESDPDEMIEDDSFDEAAAESSANIFGDDGSEIEDDEEDEDEDDVSVDLDTEVEIESETDDSGITDGETVEVDDDPFESITDEESDGIDESDEDPFGSDVTEDEPELETSSDDDDTDDGVFVTDDGTDDLFDSEFDDDGGVEFDELVEETRNQTPDQTDTEEIDSIKVNVDQLDDLYSLVQELVTSRIRLRRAISDGDSTDRVSQAFDELDALETVSSRMQDTVMDIRLVRLERITDRLPRVVRDTARENGKEVDFEIEGEDVELDRAILEQLRDPLMHIVRNAVDHGIEDPETRKERGKSPEGKLRVSARRTRDRVTIQIEDDGGGINPDEIRRKAVEEGILTEKQADEITQDQVNNLIFHPGFSTSGEVSETSGRGVGLDVVYTTIRSLDGSVNVSTTPGEGTTFTLRLPISLAIDEVLLIESGGEEFGIPTKNISEITAVKDIKEVNGKESHIHKGDVYTVVGLDEQLGTDEISDNGRLVRLDKGVRQAVIKCDNVIKATEVVVEPYDGVLRTVPGLSGAAVLGEGDVVNILDVERL